MMVMMTAVIRITQMIATLFVIMIAMPVVMLVLMGVVMLVVMLVVRELSMRRVILRHGLGE